MSAAAPIAFVAGEASGDLLAAPVVAALAAATPPWPAVGIAGERMIAAGCEPWHHVRELSVRGYLEVLRQLPRLVRLRSGLVRRLQATRCAAVVGVDAPDFNLAIETAVRRAGTPTVHYVSPSIWAWRAKRIEKIRRAADRVLLVFPFEQAIYDRAGIPATYVGHPLAASIPLRPDRAAARARLGEAADAALIALLPGSRAAEIRYIAPSFLEAASLLLAAQPSLRFLLPVADGPLRAAVEEHLARRTAAGVRGLERVRLVAGRSHDCLEACDGALVASGTATLEAALYKRPMVIAYRMPEVTARIMLFLGGYLPWVGLPNILANESIVPELLQGDCTPRALADALLAELDDGVRQARLADRYEGMHHSLLRDSAALASAAIVQTIEEARRR